MTEQEKIELNKILHKLYHRIVAEDRDFHYDALVEAEDQIIAMFPDVEEAKREVREQILRIVKEYGLDVVSARDDVLEMQAKGWQALRGKDE